MNTPYCDEDLRKRFTAASPGLVRYGLDFFDTASTRESHLLMLAPSLYCSDPELFENYVCRLGFLALSVWNLNMVSKYVKISREVFGRTRWNLSLLGSLLFCWGAETKDHEFFVQAAKVFELIDLEYPKDPVPQDLSGKVSAYLAMAKFLCGDIHGYDNLPSSPESYLAYAFRCGYDRDVDLCEDFLLRGAEEHTSDPRLWWALGYLYHILGDSRSKFCLRKALQTMPGWLQAENLLSGNKPDSLKEVVPSGLLSVWGLLSQDLG